MNKKIADYLLNKTLDDYNLIGYDFSSKRAFITQDLLDLVQYAQVKDKILDLGCGNGRVSEIFENMNIDYTGVDISKTLLSIARQKYPDKKFEQIDFFKLPFPDNHFDKIYCLSVLHHIPSVKYRIKFLKEARRVLKKDGQLILTVWYLLAKNEIKLTIIKNSLAKIFFLSKLDFKDVYLAFKRSKDQNLADRYIHCFTKRELINLLSKTGFSLLLSGFQKRGKKIANINLYAISVK